MGADFGKNMYRQPMDVMGKPEAIEDQHQKDRTEIRQLTAETRSLRMDNERMKRILNNDSSNSSCPPSSDQHGKAPNTYTGRKATKKKPGAQPGHKGRCLSEMDVEDKIRKGIFEHRTGKIGAPGNNKKYIKRYRLDLHPGPVPGRCDLWKHHKSGRCIFIQRKDSFK